MTFSFIKKTFVVIFSFTLLFVCSACDKTFSDNGKTSVVATNFPAYDFASHVCKDAAEVTMLLPAGAESHSYEPTAQDIIKIQNCDLFIYTGGESDVWVDKILNSLDSKVRTLKMTECVSLLPVGNSYAHFDEHAHDEFDEHVWTSPVNAIQIITKIKDKLTDFDVENANFYKNNANEYIKEITTLDSNFRDFFDTVENKTMVFGDRFPLVYFANEYDIRYYAAFPGCADHSEPGATTIANLIQKIDSEKIPTVYYIEFSNHNIADTLAEATGASTALFHTCHNVSKDQISKGVTYVSLMKDNLETLKNSMK